MKSFVFKVCGIKKDRPRSPKVCLNFLLLVNRLYEKMDNDVCQLTIILFCVLLSDRCLCRRESCDWYTER
jgi:hypothetical protein